MKGRRFPAPTRLSAKISMDPEFQDRGFRPTYIGALGGAFVGFLLGIGLGVLLLAIDRPTCDEDLGMACIGVGVGIVGAYLFGGVLLGVSVCAGIGSGLCLSEEGFAGARATGIVLACLIPLVTIGIGQSAAVMSTTGPKMSSLFWGLIWLWAASVLLLTPAAARLLGRRIHRLSWKGPQVTGD